MTSGPQWRRVFVGHILLGMFVGFVAVMKTVSLEQLKAKFQALSERLLQNVSIRKQLRRKNMLSPVNYLA